MKRTPTILMVLVFCLMMAPVLAAGSKPDAKRPLTFEDMVKLQQFSSVTVAPDGNRLAFATSGRDLASNSFFGSVWVMDLPGGMTRRITAGGKNESSPAWSPDSKTLAFVSNAGENKKAQIWKVGMAGGQPLVVTSIPTGASGPTWHPDGKHILFTSSVFPECTTAACNAGRLTDEDEAVVKAKLIDNLMYRHWDHWKDGRVTHVFSIPAEGGKAIDLMPGDLWGVYGSWDLSPDGELVIYETKDIHHQERHTNNDLYMVRVALAGDGKKPGRPAQLTRNEAFDGHPVFSPNGQYVAYLSQERARFEADRFKLTVMPLDSPGKLLFPTEGMDRWVVEMGWFPDSKGLWYSVMDAGRINVYSTDVEGKHGPQKVFGGAYHQHIDLRNDGKTFFAISQSLTKAEELWQYRAEPIEQKQLTRINQRVLENVQLATVEEVWWKGAGGTQVHGFVLFPPGTSKEKKNPMLFLIHGGPQGMWGDRLHPRWNAQLFAAPGFVTFMPNPRGSIGYGQKFLDEISRDWGGKVYEDLMNGVDFIVEKGWVDPDRMCAAGGSYGGYMVNWILGHTDRFKCLISHAGVYDLKSKYGTTDELWFPEWEFGGPPWESEDYDIWSPSNFVKNFKTPTLVIHGQHDYRVSVNQAMQLFTALQRMGVPSKYLYYPDETHFIWKPANAQLWYQVVHAWVKEWTGTP